MPLRALYRLAPTKGTPFSCRLSNRKLNAENKRSKFGVIVGSLHLGLGSFNALLGHPPPLFPRPASPVQIQTPWRLVFLHGALDPMRASRLCLRGLGVSSLPVHCVDIQEVLVPADRSGLLPSARLVGFDFFCPLDLRDVKSFRVPLLESLC